MPRKLHSAAHQQRLPAPKKAKPLTAGGLKVLKARAKAESRALDFLMHCRLAKLPAPVREHQFWEGRKFAFDFAWPQWKVALESEGGAFSGGAHTRGAHFRSDCEKYSEAAIRGWCVVRVLSGDLTKAATLDLVRRALESRVVKMTVATGGSWTVAQEDVTYTARMG